MACSRAYCQDSAVPACGSNWMPQNGAYKGRQVYLCGDCGRYYTHRAAYARPQPPVANEPLALHKEGVSQSAAARRIGVTPPVVNL